MRGSTITIMLTCGALLWISVWPGRLFQWIALLIVPVTLIGLIVMARSGRGKKATRKVTLASNVMMCITPVLLVFHVPQHIAFAACSEQFEDMAAAAPDGWPYKKVKPPRKIGPYVVDAIGKQDEGGGVFLRVYAEPFGLFDRTSYGYVFRPTHSVTPFGAGGLSLYKLNEDWYVFAASN